MHPFLDQLATAEPMPGGGAVAALAGALGAALAHMGAGLTLGRRRYQPVHAQIAPLLAQADELRHQLQQAIEDDQTAYSHLMALWRQHLPPHDPALQAALRGAAEVPLRVARLSAAVIRLAHPIATQGNPNTTADVVVGALLAHAAVRASRLNVLVNLRDLTDEPLRAQWTAEVNQLAATATTQLEALLTHAETSHG